MEADLSRSCPSWRSVAFYRVINSIQTSDIRNLFNPENVYMSKEGGGAGNNWASGYTQGEAVQETLLDMFGGFSSQHDSWWIVGWGGLEYEHLTLSRAAVRCITSGSFHPAACGALMAC